jgi:radical SAM protein with 4Fe4S-binding SPASM domain
MITTNNLIKEKKRVKKFHQFIGVEKGPVNSAVIDLLKGNVYQVENEIIDKFETHAYEEIPDFMESAMEEGLIIEVHPHTWIPDIHEDQETGNEFEEENRDTTIVLHVEEGVNMGAVFEKLKGVNIRSVVFYGKALPNTSKCPAKIEIIQKEKNFRTCMEMSNVDGNFNRVNQTFYLFNRRYNSCWGTKIAITSDGIIRPCIYSEIDIGNYETLSIDQVLEKLKPYWELTKDKIEKCKDCELRHICFDCREIARKSSGDLKSVNPQCKYNPYKGTWGE